MTDTRTPKEINEAIALLRGWRKEPAWNVHGPLNPGWFWISPDTEKPILEHPPNYLGEGEHALLLMVEMWEAGFDLSHDNIDGTFYWWKIGNDGPEPLNDDRGETTDVNIATGLDWLAWKEKR
ncbi:hypothetical protein LCGC14_1207740 [marine sediment metagenome]|uniref:Uncharacterized protein n=1 Tax=marine sediment metagenome TaxID=412755 RepID=A0A0F9PJP6_9ZZZZ